VDSDEEAGVEQERALDAVLESVGAEVEDTLAQ
jgi:hypothetical protein